MGARKTRPAGVADWETSRIEMFLLGWPCIEADFMLPLQNLRPIFNDSCCSAVQYFRYVEFTLRIFLFPRRVSSWTAKGMMHVSTVRMLKEKRYRYMEIFWNRNFGRIEVRYVHFNVHIPTKQKHFKKNNFRAISVVFFSVSPGWKAKYEGWFKRWCNFACEHHIDARTCPHTAPFAVEKKVFDSLMKNHKWVLEFNELRKKKNFHCLQPSKLCFIP